MSRESIACLSLLPAFAGAQPPIATLESYPGRIVMARCKCDGCIPQGRGHSPLDSTTSAWMLSSICAEWCLLKQFHKYMKSNWPRKHTEKHGKINCLTGNGSLSFRVFPCISVAGFLSKCHSYLCVLLQVCHGRSKQAESIDVFSSSKCSVRREGPDEDAIRFRMAQVV